MVGADHAQKGQRWCEEHGGGDEYGHTQAEVCSEVEERRLQPGYEQDPSSRSGEDPGENRQTRTAIGEAPADGVSDTQRSQGDRDQSGPEKEAHSVEGPQNSGTDDFESQDRGTGDADQKVGQ